LALIRGTRAVQLLKGVLILMALTGIAYGLDLRFLKWTLEKVWTMAFVAVPVVFQPEIRRVLERLGQGAPFLRSVAADEARLVVSEVAEAAAELSRSRTGALVVFERGAGLREYVETGVPLDALVSKKLLLAIYEPHTPLHDGAVIIRGKRIAAAGCYLPLAAQNLIPPDLGTRHLAAVGLSEQSDALVVVVSEETGSVSLVEGGRLTSLADARETGAALKERLFPESLGKRHLGRDYLRKFFGVDV
jgi:diadenylate cyclase